MRPSIRLALAVILPLLILVVPAIATPTTTITVCPLGCDYTAIQPAIGVAVPGDTILIAAGTYTEQLTLKSNLTLVSQAGPTQTVVTALASPIISGSNLNAVTLEGLGVTGSETVTDLIGIDLLNSSVLLSNTIISGLHGASGTPVYTNGLNAIGLQVSGTFSVTLFNSIVENIQGGTADVNSGGRGGDAFGISARGEGQLSIISSTVQNLVGGTPGAVNGFMYCAGVGGNSLGIDQAGPADLSVEHSTISGVVGGHPCRFQPPYQCPDHAGNATAIHASGGTLAVDHSLITDNRVWASYQNAQSAGINGSGLQRVTVKNTEVSALDGVAADWPIAAPASPFCTAGNASMIALSLNDNQQVSLENNQLSDLHGFGIGGTASGITAYNTAQITATGNQVSHLSGGSGWLPDEAYATVNGILFDTATRVTLDSNRISELHGGSGEPIAYSFHSQGGAAVGLWVNATTYAYVTNNIVNAIHGGAGLNYTYPWGSDSQDGGNASGLLLNGSSSWVQNNTVYDIRGGEHGYPQGIAGRGTGIKLINLLNALVINNAFISTTVGVSATASNYIWDYNALWHNTLNYSGVVTGPHDVFADPWFADPAAGDFHLPFSSPLIDAGFNLGAPLHDFAGTPRPLDGNNDGIARTDIGVYEYQYVPLNFVYLPIIRWSQP